MLLVSSWRLALVCTILHQVHCVFRLASNYGNHMVLQRAPQQATIWGYGLHGAHITVAVAGTYTVLGRTLVNNIGQTGLSTWLVKLKPVPAGGPFNLVITQHHAYTTQKIHLSDVYFGDVWLCSGQSNMEMNLIMAHRGAQEIPLANNYSKIRLMAVQRNLSHKPVEEIDPSRYWYKPSPWAPASAATVGGNTLHSFFSAICWMYGRLLYDKFGGAVPIGLIQAAHVGSAIEAWTEKELLACCGITTPVTTDPQNQFSVLWNSMINPLLKTSIYGVIWYQGESNTLRSAHLYDCEFTQMINSWRKEWHLQSRGATRNNFPFGFVQLSTLGFKLDHPLLKVSAKNLPEFRHQQSLVNRHVANTFMAVSLDLPDDVNNPYGAIHPRFKFEVSRRLVEGALAVAYESPTYWTGPIAEKITLVKLVTVPLKWHVNIIFSPSSIASTGILLKHHLGFEIKITNKQSKQFNWLPAEGAQVTSHNIVSLVITLDTNLFTVTGVRYNWSNQPCSLLNCAVYSGTMPAIPFIFNAPF